MYLHLSSQVEGEEAARFERMIVMDGNNSLKRVGATGMRTIADVRTFSSDYYLARELVEQFAGEVKSRQAQIHVEVPIADPEEQDDVDEHPEGDPTDGAPSSACASNWIAAVSDDKKRMWAIFEETGIFASCCRHGFILWLVDMIRSGEL